ncbi:MAG: hypothetical protein AAGA68_27450, partial [Pseudomonadota bacterium]
MSYWSRAEVAKLKQGGNSKARAVWQATLPEASRLKPGPSLDAAKDFVRICYIEKKWYDEAAAANPPQSAPVPTKRPVAAVPGGLPAPPKARPVPLAKAPVVKPVPVVPKPVAKVSNAHVKPAPKVVDLLSFDEPSQSEAEPPADDFFGAFAAGPVPSPPAAAAIAGPVPSPPAAAIAPATRTSSEPARAPPLDPFATISPATPTVQQFNRVQSVPNYNAMPQAAPAPVVHMQWQYPQHQYSAPVGFATPPKSSFMPMPATNGNYQTG